MHRGKRAIEKGFDWASIPIKKIAIILLIIIVIVTLILFSVQTINKRKEEQNVGLELQWQDGDDDDELPDEYEGYKVIGQLVIDKIELRQYILESDDDSSAMEKATVKLYGNEINSEGNFCIAGHNYPEIFERLDELRKDDEFYIIDKNDIIQDYVVTEILEVEPTDLTPLMPVEDKIQVTLITCIDGATKRLVIKAERVQIEG